MEANTNDLKASEKQSSTHITVTTATLKYLVMRARPFQTTVTHRDNKGTRIAVTSDSGSNLVAKDREAW